MTDEGSVSLLSAEVMVRLLMVGISKKVGTQYLVRNKSRKCKLSKRKIVKLQVNAKKLSQGKL